MGKLNYTYISGKNFDAEIGLTKNDVRSIAVGGCDNGDAVKYVCSKPYIRRQFDGITDEQLKEVLSLYSERDFKDRKQAIEFIIWLCAWDIREEKNW